MSPFDDFLLMFYSNWLYLVPFLKHSMSKNLATLISGSKVIQGHWKWKGRWKNPKKKPVYSCIQPRPLNRFSRVIRQTTRFCARMCLFGFRKQKFNIYTP